MLSEIETVVFANLKDFCNYIPVHVERWQSTIDLVTKKVQGIANLTEQYRAVNKVKLDFMENFKETQAALNYNILTCIEDDFAPVKENIEKLSRCNAELKTKLGKLEQSSLELDWDVQKSPLLRGTPLIPPLGNLLSFSLNFYTFFNQAYKNLHNCTRNVCWLDEDNVKAWEKSFVVDFNDNCVNYLLAITQYVANENSLN